LSSLKARRTAARRNRVSVPMMRPVARQLGLVTELYSKAAQKPMTMANSDALRSLALASVFLIDSLSAEMSAR